MPDTKISAETPLASVNGSEAIPAVSGGANRKLLLSTLRKALTHPGMIAGRYYVSPGHIPATGSAGVATTTYFVALILTQKVTIDTLGVSITTGAAGSFQLSIYSFDPSSGDAARIAVSVNGSTASAAIVNVALGAAATLDPGFYLVGYQVDNATAVALGTGGVNPVMASLFGSAANALTGTGVANTYSYTSTFGTWPTTISAASLSPTSSSRAPMVQFHVSAVF